MGFDLSGFTRSVQKNPFEREKSAHLSKGAIELWASWSRYAWLPIFHLSSLARCVWFSRLVDRFESLIFRSGQHCQHLDPLYFWTWSWVANYVSADRNHCLVVAWVHPTIAGVMYRLRISINHETVMKRFLVFGKQTYTSEAAAIGFKLSWRANRFLRRSDTRMSSNRSTYSHLTPQYSKSYTIGLPSQSTSKDRFERRSQQRAERGS